MINEQAAGNDREEVNIAEKRKNEQHGQRFDKKSVKCQNAGLVDR